MRSPSCREQLPTCHHQNSILLTDRCYTVGMATRKKQRKPAKPKKAASKKSTPKKKLARRVPRKKASPKKKSRIKRIKNDATATLSRPEGLRARSGGQSGNLQGLSDAAGADSESVDELLEEGNAFEAEVVKGVQDVTDESEVVTHEVPEDDVPEEYLDKE
jgi:hypothetical protein